MSKRCSNHGCVKWAFEGGKCRSCIKAALGLGASEPKPASAQSKQPSVAMRKRGRETSHIVGEGGGSGGGPWLHPPAPLPPTPPPIFGTRRTKRTKLAAVTEEEKSPSPPPKRAQRLAAGKAATQSTEEQAQASELPSPGL